MAPLRAPVTQRSTLDRVCAATPITLRRCNPGEHGVVISRYNPNSGYDWIAIPLIPYLYAVENQEDIPLYADLKLEAFLRDQYAAPIWKTSRRMPRAAGRQRGLVRTRCGVMPTTAPLWLPKSKPLRAGVALIDWAQFPAESAPLTNSLLQLRGFRS